MESLQVATNSCMRGSDQVTMEFWSRISYVPHVLRTRVQPDVSTA